jgi:arabinan endo-1,5-alpha-L-arabinosidase
MKNNTLRKIIFAVLGTLVVSSCSSRTPVDVSIDTNTYTNGTYQNALFVANTSGTYYSAEVADPCVVRDENGEFWSFSTARRVLHSVDGCEWEKHSDGIIPKPHWGDAHFAADGKNGAELWAPDVVKIGDKWIYYYSISDFGYAAGIGYATADEIGGPYTDHGRMFWSEETGETKENLMIHSSIDQQIIFGDDGHVYMVLGSFSKIWMIQLTDDGLGLYNGWEYQKQHKILIASNRFEGSWIFKRGDYWYYMGSAGTCCSGKDSTYRVRVGKSESLFGPYIDSEGKRMDALNEENGDLVVWAKKSNENTIAPGHNSVIMDDAGDFWWYGHCFYEYDAFRTRHLAMDKLEWDENDMPYIKGYELSYNEELPGPRILVQD